MLISELWVNLAGLSFKFLVVELQKKLNQNEDLARKKEKGEITQCIE